MGTFKETDYYKSENHLENSKNAAKLGRLKIQELKEQRINEYYENPKLCEECGEIISYEYKNEKKFCNSSCSAKFNNKRRIVDEEQKLKTSITLLKRRIKRNIDKEKIILNDVIRICLNCEKEFLVNRNKRVLSHQKYCCKECSNIGMKRNTSLKAKERVKNGTHKGWTTRNITSYPEKFFMEVLKNNKLNYIHNFIINKKDLGLDDKSNYFLDFYFEDKKIDLEIDGKQHKSRKGHDELRDSLLEKIGIKIYRIEWKNPINDKNKEYMKNEINKFLEYYLRPL